jgi:hypothetical protein
VLALVLLPVEDIFGLRADLDTRLAWRFHDTE